MTFEPILPISLTGEPYDRGYQHGSEAKMLIEGNINTYLRIFKHFSNLDRNQVLKEAKKFIPVIEKYDFEILEEIQGVAAGAERKLEEIVALNVRSEIMFGGGAGCTSFAIMPDAASSKHTLIGQNWDWNPALKSRCIILEIRQNGKPNVVCFTEAGIIGGKQGFNSTGIGLCVNALLSDKDRRRSKTPFHIICRGILNSKTLSDAIGAVVRTERPCSANYVIAHADGECIDLEAAPHDAGWIYPENGVLVHSNHFITRLDVKDFGKVRWPDTLTRYHRMKRLLERSIGHIDIETIQQIMRDHFGKPNSICRHADGRVHEYERIITVSSIIIDLNEKQMYIAYPGPPCENEYKLFSPRV